MSSVLLAVVALSLLVLGYRYYSPRVARWLALDLDQTPPSAALQDGVDYIPAKHWTILFGHHFASIAGAAPIIGPVIACLYWGWLPAVIWLVLGAIFMGGVHDLSALVLSLKNQGVSIATLAESILGRPAKIAFSFFAFLALILIVAVFAAVAGKTLATTPQVVIPTFGLIVVAVIVGYMLYYMRLALWLCSLLGVALLFGLIVAGYFLPVSLPVANAARWWTVILIIYGLIASVTPVNILLQPRDHLAAGVLFLGMVLGFGGLLLSHPAIHAPAFNAFTSIKGSLWPMLFVTVACGAISGFHSLVASGTTSKQLPRMQDARRIGYGAMITESALSILAVLAVTAGLYWKSAPAGGFVYQEVFHKGGWIKAFGVGYGQLTSPVLGGLGMLVGITMLKTFVMTTLDSATRIARYVANELLGDAFHLPLFKNKYVATLLVGVVAGWLALGDWKAIWPLFGAANQLIASLVLLVVSVYLMVHRRSPLFVALPGVFMLVTTLTALGYQLRLFLRGPEPKLLLGLFDVLLILMAFFLLYAAVKAVRDAARERGLTPAQ